MLKKPLNKYFDHTLLKPESTKEDIVKLCQEALEYDFFAVCVNSCFVPLAVSLMKDSDVAVASVVGFPLGTASTEAKVWETNYACREGSAEIDMVMNIGMFKSKMYDYVQNDIANVVDEAHKHGAIVKVIIETCLLDDNEIAKACQLAMNVGADFVKTSTGFNSGGATAEDVTTMRNAVGDSVQVKASGGIRDYDTTIKMINAGADRIGASASVDIMKTAMNNK